MIAIEDGAGALVIGLLQVGATLRHFIDRDLAANDVGLTATELMLLSVMTASPGFPRC